MINILKCSISNAHTLNMMLMAVKCGIYDTYDTKIGRLGQ